MVFQWIALLPLGFAAMLAALYVAIIPWRFEPGKSWFPIPIKMSYPAVVWPMTILSAATAVGGLIFILAAQAFTAIWYISMAITVLAAGAGIAHGGYILRVTRSHTGFAEVFGADWLQKLQSGKGMLSRRWSPIRYPNRPVRLKRDESIWSFAESDRQLLADVWQPPEDTKPTGVAFLFFHGSAWHFFDKGIGTDPMFRHLAAQGHVIIDVAYRLAPEVDIAGMTADVKRAVVWTKQNAARLGVDPNKIVVGGASAGGHIALLAAYGHGHPAFTPEDLEGSDASVAGVISMYTPCDFRAYLNHHAGRLSITGKPADAKAPVRFDAMSAEQMMMNLCGGMPDAVPLMFDLADAKTHVSPNAPPTLIFQGDADFIAPKTAMLQLVERLKGVSVPVVYVEFYQTEHVWDVITDMAAKTFPKQVLPSFLKSQYAPQTQATIYDIERFLAYIA